MATFEEFQATKRKVADLATLGLGYEDYAGIAGLAYMGNKCTIELTKEGKYMLVIHNWGKISDNLEELERELYKWATAEGIC